MKNKIMLAGAVVVVVAVGLCAIASRTAKTMIENARHDIAGLALEIGGYEVSFITAKLKLKDIKIYPAGKETPEAILASTEKLSIRVAPIDLLLGKLHVRNVELEKPNINYVVTGKRSANWDTLNLGKNGADTKKDSGGKALPIIVDKVEIDDGTVSYRNTVNGQHIELKDVDIEVENIKAANKQGDLPTKVDFDARIGDSQGKISAMGKADVLGEGISFDIDGTLSSTPIGEFASFYAGQVPFQIVAGSISVSSKAKAVDNKLTSSNHATIYGLKAGGAKGELINKLVLSHAGPLSVDVSVNGDLSTGDLSVSTALSKNIAEEIMKRATISVPGEVVEKVKELKPLKGLKGLFKK